MFILINSPYFHIPSLQEQLSDTLKSRLPLLGDHEVIGVEICCILAAGTESSVDSLRARWISEVRRCCAGISVAGPASDLLIPNSQARLQQAILRELIEVIRDIPRIAEFFEVVECW
jgi:hypothetical protein